jgi:uncharacterized protein (TIGR02588 family)
MAVSIPDPSGALPETSPGGHTGTHDRPAVPASGRAAPETETPSSATSRRDALRSRSSERPDASAGPRSAAEWITLAISSLIVLGLIALTTYFYLTDPKGPAIVEVEAHLDEVYRSGSRYYLPLTVRNTGGETGEEVRVRVAVMDPSGRQEAAEVIVAFLAGGGSSRAVAAFGSDPRQGQVEAVVVSYLEP